MNEVSLLARIDDLEKTFDWLGERCNALNKELDNIDFDTLSFSHENREMVKTLKNRIDELQKRYKINAILYNNLLKEIQKYYTNINGIDFIDGLFEPL